MLFDEIVELFQTYGESIAVQCFGSHKTTDMEHGDENGLSVREGDIV
jgi:hypothetical protein